jgi:hypothetical protein
MDCPPEQVLFQAADAPEAEMKHPAGTPEYSDTAEMSSGYVAAKTFDIIPPELPPVTNTFFGSILYLSIAYVIMFAMAFESPPPLCVSEALLETSQHSVVELGQTVT